MALVIDTSVLLAALNRKDPRHAACRELIAGAQEERVLPAPVLVELDYWIRKVASVGAWLRFCEDLNAGAYILRAPDPALIADAARLQARYEDLRLGFVDAAVFVTCIALEEQKVATLDRRDFSVLRTEDGRALRILP